MTFHDLFYSDFYFVAFREVSVGAVQDNRKQWTVIRSSRSEWFADPFLFEWQGHRWLFVERMDKWRLLGSIAVCEILDNQKTTSFKEVLVEPFHLSYPNVFESAGEVYMIPETGANRDIRLYHAVEFPYKWELVKVLYEGKNFVDTSFVLRNLDNHAILNSYDWDTRESYYFDFELQNMTLNRLPDNPLMMNERNGGNAFVQSDSVFRVLQDCSNQYGSKIMICRVNNHSFETGMAADSLMSELLPKGLIIDKNLKPTRCHTYNRSENFEVIDFNAERFVWFGPVMSVRNKFYYERNKNRLG